MPTPPFLPIGPDIRQNEPAPRADSAQPSPSACCSRLAIGFRLAAPVRPGPVTLGLPRAEAPQKPALQFKPDQMPADD